MPRPNDDPNQRLERGLINKYLQQLKTVDSVESKKSLLEQFIKETATLKVIKPDYTPVIIDAFIREQKELLGILGAEKLNQ